MNCDLSELTTALVEASRHWPQIRRDTEVGFGTRNGRVEYSYASLGQVMGAIRGPLAEQGLVLTHQIRPIEGRLELVTTLHHTSGQSLTSSLPLGQSPTSADEWKAFGASVTYARRYCTLALLAIGEESDESEIHKPARKDSHPANPYPQGGTPALGQRPRSRQTNPTANDADAEQVLSGGEPADPALIASGWRSPEDAQLWSADLVLPSGESLYRHSSHARNAYSKAREEYIASLPPEQRPNRMDPITGEVASPEEKRRHFRVLNCYWVERCLARTRGEEYVLEPWEGSERIENPLCDGKPSGRVFDQPIAEDEAIHELPESSLSRPAPT